MLPLNKKDRYYEMVHMAFHADRADYKTLKIENPGNYVFHGPIQEFINTGRFVEADKRAKERKLQIQNSATSPVLTQTSEPQQEEVIQKNSQVPLQKLNLLPFIVVIGLGGLFLLLKVWKSKR